MSWGDTIWGEFAALPITLSGPNITEGEFIDLGAPIVGIVCFNQGEIWVDAFNSDTGVKDNTYYYDGILSGAVYKNSSFCFGVDFLHFGIYWETTATTCQIEYIQFNKATKTFIKEIIYVGDDHRRYINTAGTSFTDPGINSMTETEAGQPVINWQPPARSMGAEVVSVGVILRTGADSWSAKSGLTEIASISDQYIIAKMPPLPGGATELETSWDKGSTGYHGIMLDSASSLTINGFDGNSPPPDSSSRSIYIANPIAPAPYYWNGSTSLWQMTYGSRIGAGWRSYKNNGTNLQQDSKFSGIALNPGAYPDGGTVFGWVAGDLYIIDIAEPTPGAGILLPGDNPTPRKIGKPYNTTEETFALNAKSIRGVVTIAAEKWLIWYTDDGAGQDYLCRVNVEEFTASRGAGHLITGGVSAPLPQILGSVYQGVPITRLDIAGGVSPPLPIVFGAVVTNPAGLMPVFNNPAEYLRYYCSAGGDSYPLTAIIIRVTKKPDDISISRKIELHFPSSQTLYNQISSNQGAEYKVEADRVVSGAQERIEIAAGIMSSRWLGTLSSPIIGEFGTVYFKQVTKDINPDAAIVWGTNSARFPMDLAIEPGDTLFNRRTIKSVTHYFYAEQPALTEVFF